MKKDMKKGKEPDRKKASQRREQGDGSTWR